MNWNVSRYSKDRHGEFGLVPFSVGLNIFMWSLVIRVPCANGALRLPYSQGSTVAGRRGGGCLSGDFFCRDSMG